MKTTLNKHFIFDPNEIPKIPMEFSEESRKWWAIQKSRCINGYTVGGKWMSPNLYFYVNFWKILLNKGKSKTKTLATPLLRDIEWQIFTAWSLARGLSGFTNIGEIPNDLSTEAKMEWLWNLPNDNPGFPLYNNDAKDLMLLGPREFGKSYIASGGIIAHEWLFNGSKEYDLEHPENQEKTITNITVGAGDTKYSSKLLAKFKLGYDILSKQGITFNGKYYPHPFIQQYSGSFLSGKDVIAEYRIKKNGAWTVTGTKSTISHVAYKINEFAAQGSRNPVMIKEEIGMFENLDKARESDKETMMNGTYKFGSCFYLGCVCKGTKVWTNEGKLVNIENLNQSDGIIGYGTNSVSKENILHLNPPQEKPCYRITTNRNTILECSEDHPILSSNQSMKYSFRENVNSKRIYKGQTKRIEWKQTKDLKIKDQVVLLNSIPIFGNVQMWEPRLVGMLIGDGSYGFNKTPILSNCDEEINKYIDTKFTTKIEKTYQTNLNKTYRETRILNICKNLRKLKIYGQTKLNKTLPPNIYDFDKNSICELLAGLIDTDGTIGSFQNNKGITVSITSSSENLLREVKFLFTKLGVHGNINKTIPKHKENKKIQGKNPWFTYIVGDIDSVYNIYKNITLLCKYKQKKLNTIIDFIKLSKSTRYTNGIFTTRVKGKKETATLTDIEGIRFETIKSIESIGNQPVYNLSAGTTHTYIANNIITHNTGGDMEKGTLAAYKMYYDPETYDILPFEDKWENKGKIGMFIPATMRAMEHKDSEGNTIEELAINAHTEERNRLKKGKNSRNALDAHIQYNPLVPSEIFLRKIGNIFDTPSLMEQLAKLESNKIYKDAEYIGNLVINEYGIIEWKKDDTLKPITSFPISKSEDAAGCIVIYEMPVEEPMHLRYIASNDPYNHEQMGENSSLGSTFIYDRLTKRLVAEYTGHPQTHKEYYENTRRLIKFYNARCMYENQIKGFFDYLDHLHETYLLADQPDKVLKDIIQNSKVNRGKGCHASEAVIHFGEEWINTWLLEKSDDDPEFPDKRNLHNIRSIPLLKELIMYNPDNNFDRVSSLIMLMIYIQELKHITADEKTDTTKTAFHQSSFFMNNKSYTNPPINGWIGKN